MRYFKYTFVSIMFLGFFLSGCASTAKKTGYLQDYGRLHKGKYLENYWLNSSLINEKKYSVILVETINVDRISDQKGITAEDCRKWLGRALMNASRSLESHFVFEEDSKHAQAKLKIAITEMTPGSAAGRMFAGEFGMGHAWVQVEGKIVDIEKNEELAVFSDRRRASGATGLADLTGDAGPDLVYVMLDQIAAGIIRELRESFAF